MEHSFAICHFHHDACSSKPQWYKLISLSDLIPTATIFLFDHNSVILPTTPTCVSMRDAQRTSRSQVGPGGSLLYHKSSPVHFLDFMDQPPFQLPVTFKPPPPPPLDAPGQRRGPFPPLCGSNTESFGGSVGTTSRGKGRGCREVRVGQAEGERPMGTAACGGRGCEERARGSGERPIGSARCRQPHNPAPCQSPPLPSPCT